MLNMRDLLAKIWRGAINFFDGKLSEITAASLAGAISFYWRAEHDCAIYESECSKVINGKVVYAALAPATVDFFLKQIATRYYSNNNFNKKRTIIWDEFFDSVGMHGFFIYTLNWLAAEIPAFIKDISDSKKQGEEWVPYVIIPAASILTLFANSQVRWWLRKSINWLFNLGLPDFSAFPALWIDVRGKHWKRFDAAMNLIGGMAGARAWFIAGEVLATHTYKLTPTATWSRLAGACVLAAPCGLAAYWHPPQELDKLAHNQQLTPNKKVFIKTIYTTQKIASVLFIAILLYFMINSVSDKNYYLPSIWSAILALLNLLLCCCGNRQNLPTMQDGQPPELPSDLSSRETLSDKLIDTSEDIQIPIEASTDNTASADSNIDDKIEVKHYNCKEQSTSLVTTSSWLGYLRNNFYSHKLPASEKQTFKKTEARSEPSYYSVPCLQNKNLAM